MNFNLDVFLFELICVTRYLHSGVEFIILYALLWYIYLIVLVY